MSFSQEEVEEFESDAMEMLDSVERDLLALDKGGELKAIYDAIFRVFHSLKDAAGMMALHALQEHFHRPPTSNPKSKIFSN